VRAAVNLHDGLLDQIMRLPMSFFDSNPSGRVINRFSRDTEILDSVLPMSLMQLAASASSYIGTLILIAIVTGWFALVLPILTLAYFTIQRYYMPGAREMQRLESVTRSPIYTGFGEAVQGITTIRAYSKEAHFTGMEDKLITENGLVYLTQRAGSAWLSMRLDMLGLSVLACTAMLVVFLDIDPALSGLVLAHSLELTKFLQLGARIVSKVESDFNSVERMDQYMVVRFCLVLATSWHDGFPLVDMVKSTGWVYAALRCTHQLHAPACAVALQCVPLMCQGAG
jgi:ATP-binding cassette, subfamily C (CFTR/MRP), member 1